MKHLISLTLFAFLCSSSLLFAAEMRLEDLLSKEELEAIQLEALLQERKSNKASAGNVEKNEEEENAANPYAALLKKNGIKTQAEKKEERTTPPVIKSKSSSYSKDYRRYRPGNNRPGDAFKSTPAQRAFGK